MGWGGGGKSLTSFQRQLIIVRSIMPLLLLGWKHGENNSSVQEAWR